VSEEDEIEERRELVGVGVQRERRFSTAARGFILAATSPQWMRTSERRQPASSCVARRVATPGAAALPRRQSTPLLEHCRRPYPNSFGVLQNSAKI